MEPVPDQDQSVQDQLALLGFLQGRITNETREPDAHRQTKFGGQPLFPTCLGEQQLQRLSPDLICSQCDHRLLFVGQVFCPLSLDHLDRILYFFACDQAQCKSDNWLLLRCVYEPSASKTTTKGTCANMTAATSVEFDEPSWDDEDKKAENTTESIEEEPSELKESIPIDSIDQTITLDSFSTGQLIPYYVEAHEERLEDEAQMNTHVEELLAKYNANKDSNDSIPATEYAAFDETNLLENYNNDPVMYKFYKRLGLCPSQVLRYHWNQSPLVNVGDFQTPSSECSSCGAKRVFELQLMPGLLHFLRYQRPVDSSKLSSDSVNYNRPTNLDFATLLAYTCSQNCSGQSLHFESCILLKEIDLHLPEEFANSS